MLAMLSHQHIHTFNLSRSVALVQSLSSLILVTLGKRMDIPPAVCTLDLVNSAPVISQMGAAWGRGKGGGGGVAGSRNVWTVCTLGSCTTKSGVRALLIRSHEGTLE